MFKSERNRWFDRLVIRCANTNRDIADAECVARRNLHDIHHWWFVQIVVMGNAIAHIERQHFHHLRNNEVESHRAVDRDRGRFGRHDPTGGDHIVEICEVIAMEVCHENGREGCWTSECACEPHHHTTTGVAQNHLVGSTNQGRGAGPVWIRDRTSGAEKRDVHGEPPLTLVEDCDNSYVPPIALAVR